MKRRHGLLGAAFILLGVSVGSGYLAKDRQPPGFVVDDPDKDFGTVRQGSKVEAAFQLENGFPEPVQIKQVHQSCDCTDVSLSKDTLGPGETATLKVVWHVGKRRGPTETVLQLAYTRGQMPLRRLDLRLRAEVLPDFTLRPNSLTFTKGKRGTQRVTFVPEQKADATIRRVWCDQQSFTAKVLPDGRQVEVVFDPTHWLPERAKATLFVESNSTNETVAKVELSVED